MAGLFFEIFSEDVGIFPSTDVLEDPNNPFVRTPLSQADLFDLGGVGSNVAAFYGWATALTRVPIGENQVNAAQALQNIFELGTEVAPEDLETVRIMGIRAYAQVLNQFPDSLSFTELGVPFRLATIAFQGINELAVQAPPELDSLDPFVEFVDDDWVLVDTETGPEAVRSNP
ncbi:MAG: hypothetical protein ACFB9M_02840 [Myxococcota bacterium]